MSADFLDGLRAIVGAARVLTEAADVAAYCTDWRGRYTGGARCVVLPGGTQEVAAVVAACAEAGVAVVPQGGNTGLCGGATPTGDEVVIVLTRLNRIRAIDPDNNSITVEAGCTLHAVQEAAREADRLFPLSLAAEGTLGLITAATLKLYPRPRAQATAWVAVPDPAAAVALLGRLRDAAGDNVTAFEIVGRPALELVLKHIPGARDPLLGKPEWQLLVELSGARADLAVTLETALEGAAEAGLVADAVVASSEAKTAALWALRENVSEAQKIEGVSIKHDIAVPVSRIAEFIARADAALRVAFPAVRIVCFGHIGDGNLHYNQSRADAQSNAEFIAQTESVNRIVHDLVHELGGSISAEHGLGQLKREEVLRYKSEVEMEMMRTVKQALDPRGLMNPGKLL